MHNTCMCTSAMPSTCSVCFQLLHSVEGPKKKLESHIYAYEDVWCILISEPANTSYDMWTIFKPTTLNTKWTLNFPYLCGAFLTWKLFSALQILLSSRVFPAGLWITKTSQLLVDGLGISSGRATLQKACWPWGLLFGSMSSLWLQVECRHALFGFHV
jgi:hypothetical protein